jgi:ERCC4-type nuclease
MATGILMDIFEPESIETLLKQSVPVSRVDLNHLDFADYMWVDCENKTNHLERKSIDEILSNLDRVEGQLRREIQKADRTYLLYEGTFTPLSSLGRPMCQSYHASKDGKVMVPGHKYNLSYKGVMAWLDQLDRHGITIVHSMSVKTTATVLTALYDNGQKTEEEHVTFKRILKQKVYPRPETVTTRHIATLMGIEGAELGEVRAKALIMEFGDVWTVFNRSVEELSGVAGIGKVTAKRLLNAIGRSV